MRSSWSKLLQSAAIWFSGASEHLSNDRVTNLGTSEGDTAPITVVNRIGSERARRMANLILGRSQMRENSEGQLHSRPIEQGCCTAPESPLLKVIMEQCAVWRVAGSWPSSSGHTK